MKSLKPLFFYFIIIISLFFSKINLESAKELWFFFFNNYDQNNLFFFIIINISYLGWLVFYAPSKRFIFKILKIIFKISKIDVILSKLMLYLNHIYYYIFKLYRKITIKILYYYMYKTPVYNNNPGPHCLIETFDFKGRIYFPEKFENKSEALFYFLFLKKNYTIPVIVEINNKKYSFTIGEVLSFLNSKGNFLNKFCTIRYSKEFKKLLKFIKFTENYYDCYSDIEFFEWKYFRTRFSKTSNIELIPFFLKYNTICENYKQAKLFLKLFKCEQKLMRDFFCLNLFRLYNKLKNKKLFLKINTVDTPHISKYHGHYTYEYSYHYLHLLIYNHNMIFKDILCFNIINEIKTVYSIIKYSLIYKLLSFFILSEILKIVFISLLIYTLIKTWIYLQTSKKGHYLYSYRCKLFNHKIMRIIFYNLAYFFNLFLFDFNFFYLYLLNYLIITIFLIIFLSFYDFIKFFKNNRSWNYTIFLLFESYFRYYFSKNPRLNSIFENLSKVAMILKKKFINCFNFIK